MRQGDLFTDAPLAPAPLPVLSPTRIKAALACPMRHHLIYEAKVRQTKPADMWGGLAVHRALAKVNRDGRALDAVTPAHRDMAVRDIGRRHGVGGPMLDALASTFTAGVGAVEGVEVSHTGVIAGHRVRATADRLEPGFVVEYKSGGHPLSWPGWRLQAAILSALFDLPTRIQVIATGECQTVTASDYYVASAVAETASVITERDQTARPGSHCDRCVVRAHCPVLPRTGAASRR